MANKSGHIEVIAKIKQKNNADFKLLDATDVEMSDGKSAQEVIDNKQNKLTAGSGITLDDSGNIAVDSITLDAINELWNPTPKTPETEQQTK